MNPDTTPSFQRGRREHAVVIGGSMAGLLAARVLSDHFERVTLLERDRFPLQPGFRRGVPQSRHIHVLLVRGMTLLEQRFPGLKAELIAAGAVIVHWPREVLWLGPAGWGRRFPDSLEFVSCTRELLEWHVRHRVLASETIDCREGREVVGLLTDAHGARIAAVQHRARNQTANPEDAPEELPADLIVDASGRNSRLPEWLVELGYPAPEETRINAFLGYATRLYANPSINGDWKLALVQAKPPDSVRGGVIVPVEGERWIATLFGSGRDYPPTDETEFLSFAGTLRTPLLHDAIANAEPLTAIHGYQRTENRWRRYERLGRFPESLVVVGDAVCAFNPVYGQGMSVAALEARVLDECLREQRRRYPAGELVGLADRARRQIARSISTPWLMATGEDLRYPTTEGAKPGLVTRVMHRYLDRVIEGATTYAGVNRAFLEVAHLLAPPSALFRPGVLLPTLKGVDRDAIGRPAPLTRSSET
jgi:2-polyprenyl-6-methoxyphenol hydroxylase-like FAD-dependent oxidoreductase